MRVLPAASSLLSPLLALTAGVAVLGLGARARAAEPPATSSDVASFHWTSSATAPRTLRLYGSNGGITVSASADGKADVHAVIKDGDPALARIVRIDEPDAVTICVLFADEPPSDCSPNGISHGSHGDHRNPPTIDLIARIPAGVSLSATTANGSIRAHDVGGEVRASTANGNVDVSGARIVEAITANGNVDARLASVPVSQTRFVTTNGNVNVRVPRGTNADVEAATMHGEISASFPMTIHSTPGGFGPKSGAGRIGSGGARIEAKTTNGNVDIHVDE